MSTPSNTQTNPGSLKAGKGPLTGSALAGFVLGIVGTVFAQGNFVGLTQKTPNPSFLVDSRAIVTPAYAAQTATGGLAKYDTLLVASPYGSGATKRGLRAGTGVVKYAQLDVIANPKGASLDCSVVGSARTGTAGTLLFNNVSATGSVNLSNTPFVLGPTQSVKCGTLTNPGAQFRASLRLELTDSDVIN